MLRIVGYPWELEGFLYRNSIREIIRNELISETKTIHKIMSAQIHQPYTYIKEHGLEDSDIYFTHFGEHFVVDYDGNILPKAVHFDYMIAHIDNGHYDLEEALEVLKKRGDIRWLDKPEMKDIEYYNATKLRNKYLDFIWIPSDEDFEKVKTFMFDQFKFFKMISEVIFGLKRKEYDWLNDSSINDED